MNLGELRAELRTNILHDYSELAEGSDDDRLWSDETLNRYINEAQRRFARKGLILRTAADEFGLVRCVAGTSTYTLDPLVLAVISCKQGADPADLARAGHNIFNSYIAPDPLFFNPSSLSALPPGKPLAFSTDEEVVQEQTDAIQQISLKIYPTPTAPYTDDFHLRVVRLPKTLVSDDDGCELPEDHQLEMLDWAAYLALRVVDRDAEDATRAAERRAAFEAAVKAARDTVMRKMFTPQLWGFGRGGFSWER